MVIVVSGREKDGRTGGREKNDFHLMAACTAGEKNLLSMLIAKNFHFVGDGNAHRLQITRFAALAGGKIECALHSM
jgi:hypothetical protein